jgi:NADH:ubiquinone oxidoreductase subunit F (NADH-binding)/ferredoxin
MDGTSMNRRLTSGSAPVRFRVDATRCDGQGVCTLVAPDLFQLDRYGYAFVVPGSEKLCSEDPRVRASGFEAEMMCPRNAIRVDPVAARDEPGPPRPRPVPSHAPAGRLLLPDDETESTSEWLGRGGWSDHRAEDLLDEVERIGILGQGGAAFPVAAKWRRVRDSDEPLVVANGAEREPGTAKDRYLLTHRPSLVLNGLWLAMRAVGARQGIVAIDEQASEAADRIQEAIDDAASAGLLTGAEMRVQLVPTRYVAGEETALLSVIEGRQPLPRIRPPYPSDVGAFGRATLVQNIETLAQVAVAAAMGTGPYLEAGTAGCPGTGLFTVGRFGGPYRLAEREFGYSLLDLIREEGLGGDCRAVLVGGYAGSLLRGDAIDIALDPATLRSAGIPLGTKSVQVLTSTDCPVAVAAEIVGFFAGETAHQCPPCWRGLPDMADLLRDLERGDADTVRLDELKSFMETLPGRGVCSIPDGAARIALSLLAGFADEVAAHISGRCPAHDR